MAILLLPLHPNVIHLKFASILMNAVDLIFALNMLNASIKEEDMTAFVYQVQNIYMMYNF